MGSPLAHLVYVSISILFAPLGFMKRGMPFEADATYQIGSWY